MIVAIAQGNELESAKEVKRAFVVKNIEYIEVENDPALCEVRPFARMMKEIASVDPEEITFYAQAKGVTPSRPKNELENIIIWRKLMYFFCLNRINRIESILKKYPRCGCFKKSNPCEPFVSENWHFSGTFFWFNHQKMFSRSEWELVRQDTRFAVEGYLAHFFNVEEAYCLFGNEPTPNNLKGHSKDQWMKVLSESSDRNNLSKEEIGMAEKIIHGS